MQCKSLSRTVLACCLTFAANTLPAADKLDDDDVEFIEHAAVGGMLEVELGRLAAKRAANADVRAFAQRMVEEHGKANAELTKLARDKGVTLPTELKQDARDMRAKLDATKPEDFDEEYMEMMVDDHEKDVKMFEEQAKDAEDVDLRAFAERCLPTLRSHRDAAKALDDRLDDDDSTAAR
ncbi:MAG: DUF4142 domain-containing protein [Gammaproteobacteria bacterium]